MKDDSGDLQRLKHVQKCISDLHEILVGVDEDMFYRNTEKKYAVERILEIIGEAIRHVSENTLGKAKSQIPWKDIIGFRIIVSHLYFRIDYTVVYEIATERIAELKPVIEDLIEQLEK